MLLHEFKWKAEVLESDEPVLVDFWAAWCGPCRMLNPVIESLARDFKVCKVNVDTNPALAARYGIQSIPTLLYFKGGEVRDQTIGVNSKRGIISRLEKLAVTN